MGKVYIGVTAVCGHKLWGRQADCGIRWFGGMGGRWKIDGSRREGCGPGMPGPYGVAKGCAGVGRFRAIFVGGGVLDVPRRGQDPSLRCGRLEGGYGKVRGPGMPGPYGGGERLTGHC